MNITAQLLIDAVGCAPAIAERYAGPLTEACERFDINTPGRLAAWLANVGHESASLSKQRESMNYAADRLVAVFGAHRITPEQAAKYGRTATQPADQEAIANIVYGGSWGVRNLGNTQRVDGWIYRAAGPIGTTGRANFRELQPALLMAGYEDVPDFEAEPERLTDPRWGAAAAGYFWHSRGLNALADAGDFNALVRKINGGVNGLADRRLRWSKALSAINLHARAEATPANATDVPAVADTEIVPPIVSPGGYMPAGEFIPETPMDPVAGGFVLGLAKDLIGAFTPLAKAKAEKELARHTDPKMAEQIASNFIDAAVAATGRAGAVDAVSEAKRDPEVLAKVESDSMASLEKMLPLMERLNAMEQANINSARKFNSEEPLMIDTKWLRLRFIHILSLAFISFSGWFVTQNWASLTPELRGAVITLMVIAGWNGVRDYWMGSSSGSERKTAMLKSE